ncbi:MAG: glutamate--tRNA ligase [Patescibacteria group bacterium]
MPQIITRFPPSPTGYFHIGSARTALFNFLFTKKNGGKIFLRFEDTDRERSKKEYETDILESLNWLGISFNNTESVRQSERGEIYEKYLKKMIEKGNAYLSKESSPEENKRAEVIRFKNPNKKVKFDDIIRGEIEFDTTELGDFVIAKSFYEPLYHLAVVIDDFEMGVTHVIRGEDGISNTPRQILIQEAIGAPRPIYAHIPLILAPDRSKLSKRHGAVSLNEYKNQGYLPEAMINYLALLGWNPGTDQEIFNMNELIDLFDLKRVQKSGAIFNIEKLDWINKEHLKRLPIKTIQEEIGKRIFNFQFSISNEILEKIVPIILDRINKWSDVDQMLKSGELDWVFSARGGSAFGGKELNYKKENLVWKKLENDPNKFKITQDNLKEVLVRLEKISEDDFEENKIKEAIWSFAEEKGRASPTSGRPDRGEVLWPMRYALSGLEKSPDPFVLAGILGKKETIKRLKNTVELLN